MSPPISLVIFDCDGVLVDTERIAVRIDVLVLGELGWPMTEAEVVERFMGRSDEEMTADIEAHLGRRLPASWEEPFRHLYREAFEAELERGRRRRRGARCDRDPDLRRVERDAREDPLHPRAHGA